MKEKMCLEVSTTVVSRKYAPPFATLALVPKRRRGLYVGCDIFSRDYALPHPCDRSKMFSGSVDAGFVLVLQFHHRDLESD